MSKIANPIPLGDSMKEIESLIQTLEDQGQRIESAMEAYEQGVKLIRAAQQQLLELEQKVSTLASEGSESE